MAEEQGQAATQPALDVFDQAASIAKGILEAEEGPTSETDKPRDDKGRFAKEEAAKAEQKTEEEKPAEEEQATEEQAEEQTEQQKAEIRKHKLTVKAETGEDLEVEVDDEELKRGYMMEKAFRQKTAALAREKESFQATTKKEIEAKAKEYEDKLQLAEQAIWHTLAPEIQGIDWNKLANEDPAEWARKYQHVQNVNAKLAQIQSERQKLNEAKETESKAELKKKVEEAVETLKTEIPNWGDDVYRQILASGVEQGFKPDEVNAIIDPRAIKVLWKARQYDALQKAKPTVEKRSAATTPKVVKPGVSEKTDPNADKWNQGMDKLRKSGRTEDAVELARLLVANEGRQQQKR